MASANDKIEAASRPANRRGAARLAAVQALYQMEVGETDMKDTIAQFRLRFAAPDPEDDELVVPDADYFDQIVKGVLRHQLKIDPLIDTNLVDGWPVSRIDSTLRALLRAAAFELLFKPDVPAKVVISEYVDVAKAFYEGAEPGMTNGVLNAILSGLAGRT